MTLYILDPNLAHERGHHLDWDLAVARAARAAGESVVVLAHKDFHAERLGDGIAVQRWFSHACYDIRDRDPVVGAFEDFRFFNDRLADDLARLPRHRFSAADAVWMPTVNEKHLLGFVAWIKEFDIGRAPLFVAHLMFPSGLAVTAGDTNVRIVDPLAALFYGLAFRRAAGPGPEVLFFGGGRQLALEFSALSGLPIEPHPIPLCPQPRPPAAEARQGPRTVLLYSGDLKADKGFALVPELAERLCEAYPAWRVLVHANPDSGWGRILESLAALEQVARRHPNLSLHARRLGREKYDALFASADCMISTYDPTVYARKSSGVLWESVALGLPVVVPQDTWLHREAALWGGGHVTYAEPTVEAIFDGFARLSADFEALAARSAEAAARYQRLNGATALLQQFGRHWAPRLLASRLTIEPEPRPIALDALPGEGLHGVETVKGVKTRWTDRRFSIAFDWPHWLGWQITIEAAQSIAPEQIAGARVMQGEAELPTRVELDGSAGRIVVSGPGGGEAAAAVALTVTLPWTFRPDGETRDLGILLGGILLAPDSAGASAQAHAAAVKLTTPVEWIVPGQRFRMTPVVSGVAVLDPRLGGAIAFEAHGADPATARALALFVDGAPVPLSVAAAADGVFAVRAELAPAPDGQGNFAVDWDLAWPQAEAGPALEIAGLRGLPRG